VRVRVLITGGAGFVGSNVARVAADRGHLAICVGRSLPPIPDPRCAYVQLDLTDAAAAAACVLDAAPDVVVHAAILNDMTAIYADRRAGWDAYVGTTRVLADAANDAGAALAYVSTDWVFDGTQRGADEATPPNPINLYGVLKAFSELVVHERAERGLVARVAGVMGTHFTRPAMPRSQDAGFGYFVASLVDTLAAGEPFVVWTSDAINMRATPSLASESAAMLVALIEGDHTGTFHCCGGEATTRMELARVAADVFELDAGLLLGGPPDPASLPAAPTPYDTSLRAERTAEAIGYELPSVRELLRRLRAERERG
jgi:dTDP-4-dehydrorhamnose reductase